MIGLQTVAQNVMELLPYTAIRIEAIKDTKINGKRTSQTFHSTGFVIQLDLESEELPCLATSKHAIENAREIRIHFSLKDANNTRTKKTATCILKDFTRYWVLEKDYDLAVSPIGGIWELVKMETGMYPYFVRMEEGYIAGNPALRELPATSDLYAAAFPYGIADTVNNIALLRKGTNASAMQVNYNNRAIFLANLPFHPGTAGAPAYYYAKETKGEDGRKIPAKFYLLGMVAEPGEGSPKDISTIIKAPVLRSSVFALRKYEERLTDPEDYKSKIKIVKNF